MRELNYIAGKELAGYFVQPVAYVVMTVFLLLGGFFFFLVVAALRDAGADVLRDAESASLQRINLNQIVIDRCCIIFRSCW